jgi:sialate O-acetylesterase
MKKSILFFILFLTSFALLAQTLSLPKFFGNNMVLQQNTQAAVWGWAAVGKTITVTGSWGQNATTTVAANGKWATTIQTPVAVAGQAPAYTLTATDGTTTKTFTNVLIGEVWMCSGQSNMMYRMDPLWSDFNAEVAAANYPNIRFFLMPRTTSATPLTDCVASWEACNTTNVKVFSPAAYFFGRELYNHPGVNVPIGLIQNACGQSSIQAWMKESVIQADPALARYLVAQPNGYQTPFKIYNAMMAPVFPFSIKGCIWYQGEANCAIDGGAPFSTYAKGNAAMLADWRKDMGNDFSFYAAQIAPYTYATSFLSTRTGYFREAQNAITAMPKTGVIVTTDILGTSAELTEIHPWNKRTVGQRFAYLALAKDYGQNVQFLGPQYVSYKIEGSKIRITFDPTSLGSGLTTKDGMSGKTFKIAASDKKFYPALAVLEGNEIVVSSTSVTAPVAVRYAFFDGAMTNLQNKNGIAAFPFRTDNWTSEVYVDAVEPSIPNATGVENLTVQNLTIYPNPVKNSLTLKFENTDIQNINFIDSTGKAVLTINNLRSNSENIDVSYFAQGIYLLKYQQKNGVWGSSKFVKE